MYFFNIVFIILFVFKRVQYQVYTMPMIAVTICSYLTKD